MRRSFDRLGGILHFIGELLIIFSLFPLFPLIVVGINWQKDSENSGTLAAFLLTTGVASFIMLGGTNFIIHFRVFENQRI